MKPGPELDALVAEKVMGWERRPTIHGYEGWWSEQGWRWAVAGQTKDDRGEWMPSTKITCAWEVFHAISEFRSGFPPIGDMKHPARDGRSAFYKPVIQLKYYEHDGEVEVRIGRCKGVDHDDDVVVNLDCAEDKIPYAICLAALKAVGVDVSKF